MDKILRYQVNMFNKKREVILIGDLLVAGGLLKETKRGELLARQGRKKARYFFRENKLVEEEIIQTEDEAIPHPDDLFDIKLSEDKISAYIILKKEDADVKVSDVTSELDKLGVYYGVVDNSLIEGFLKYHKATQKIFKVAQGLKPESGRNAVINHLFDTEYLKPGSIVEGDYIVTGKQIGRAHV